MSSSRCAGLPSGLNFWFPQHLMSETHTSPQPIMLLLLTDAHVLVCSQEK